MDSEQSRMFQNRLEKPNPTYWNFFARRLIFSSYPRVSSFLYRRLLRQKYKRPANEVVVNPGKFVKFVREWQGDEYNIKGEEDAGFLFTELLDLVHTVLNRASDKDREYWKA